MSKDLQKLIDREIGFAEDRLNRYITLPQHLMDLSDSLQNAINAGAEDTASELRECLKRQTEQFKKKREHHEELLSRLRDPERKQVICPVCQGRGWIFWRVKKENYSEYCSPCQGRGFMWEEYAHIPRYLLALSKDALLAAWENYRNGEEE